MSRRARSTAPPLVRDALVCADPFSLNPAFRFCSDVQSVRDPRATLRQVIGGALCENPGSALSRRRASLRRAVVMKLRGGGGKALYADIHRARAF